jgi:TetR/AcrR family transcriptional regulator, acrAB operon repressor
LHAVGANLNKLKQKTEITRNALFLAAREVIGKEGYDRAQLAMIAKQAGRTKGSVYCHFKSKEDLFLAMMEYILEERRSTVSQLSIDQTGEALRVAIRTMCARAAVEDAWNLLILEYRIYALRNPKTPVRIRKLYHQLWETLFVQLLRLAEASNRSPAEVRTSLEILRAMPSSMILEANLHSKSTLALKERQALFCSVFDILFPPQEVR